MRENDEKLIKIMQNWWKMMPGLHGSLGNTWKAFKESWYYMVPGLELWDLGHQNESQNSCRAFPGDPWGLGWRVQSPGWDAGS